MHVCHLAVFYFYAQTLHDEIFAVIGLALDFSPPENSGHEGELRILT